MSLVQTETLKLKNKHWHLCKYKQQKFLCKSHTHTHTKGSEHKKFIVYQPECLIGACSSENVIHCIYLRSELITNAIAKRSSFISHTKVREKKNRINIKVINPIRDQKIEYIATNQMDCEFPKSNRNNEHFACTCMSYVFSHMKHIIKFEIVFLFFSLTF